MSHKPSRSEAKRIKQQLKDDEELIRLLKKAGRITDEDAQVYRESIENDDDIIWGAEATLAYIKDPRGWQQKPCSECDMLFATDYKFIAYCSNTCRVKALEKSGLTWHPHKSFEERWGKVIPRVVPPHALLILESAQQTSENTLVSDAPQEVLVPVLVQRIPIDEPVQAHNGFHADPELERALQEILGLEV